MAKTKIFADKKVRMSTNKFKLYTLRYASEKKNLNHERFKKMKERDIDKPMGKPHLFSQSKNMY